MKRVFGFLLLILSASAASAQTQAVAGDHPPGVKIDEPQWVGVPATFTGFGDLTPSLVGGPGQRNQVNAVRPVGRNSGYNPPSTLNAKRYHSGLVFRMASVSVTNVGPQTVKSLRLEIVFKDPTTGVEVMRFRPRKRTNIRPGATKVFGDTVNASKRNKRGDGAALSIEVKEVVYSDGTVWRQP